MGGSDEKWLINGARFFCWNIFLRKDIMIEVQIPGYPAVKAYIIDEDGESVDLSTDLENNPQSHIWKSTELSAMLRAARPQFYYPVPNLFVRSIYHVPEAYERLCVLTREFFPDRENTNILPDGRFGQGTNFVFTSIRSKPNFKSFIKKVYAPNSSW